MRHEFSLCRVYVISGSFRAFDRRPIEAAAEYAQLPGEAATTAAQATRMVENTSSTENSNSGGDHVDPPGTEGSAHWEMVNDLVQPPWDWERLKWP